MPKVIVCDTNVTTDWVRQVKCYNRPCLVRAPCMHQLYDLSGTFTDAYLTRSSALARPLGLVGSFDKALAIVLVEGAIVSTSAGDEHDPVALHDQVINHIYSSGLALAGIMSLGRVDEDTAERLRIPEQRSSPIPYRRDRGVRRPARRPQNRESTTWAWFGQGRAPGKAAP